LLPFRAESRVPAPSRWQTGRPGRLFGTDAEALSINNHGQIAGWLMGPDKVQHAFLAQSGGAAPKDLGSLGGPGKGAVAFSLNDLGQVVGYAVIAQSGPGTQVPYHAFGYADGKMSDLGTLGGGRYSWATGINAGGQIVGAADLAGGEVHGCVCFQGKLRDFNALLNPAPHGWLITGANGINDAGRVIATAAFNGGNPHAVILTPLH
jgi:probable HAF family extracellular repeat protein